MMSTEASPVSNSLFRRYVKTVYKTPQGFTPRTHAKMGQTFQFSANKSRSYESERTQLLSSTINSFSKYRIKSLRDENKKPVVVQKLDTARSSSLQRSASLRSVSKGGKGLSKKPIGSTLRLLDKSSFDYNFQVMRQWTKEISKQFKIERSATSLEDPSFDKNVDAGCQSLRQVPKTNAVFEKLSKKTISKHDVEPKVQKRVAEVTFKDLDYKAAIQNMRSIDLSKTLNEINVGYSDSVATFEQAVEHKAV